MTDRDRDKEIEIMLSRVYNAAYNDARAQMNEMAMVLTDQISLMQEQNAITRGGFAALKDEIALLRRDLTAWVPDLMKKYQFTVTEAITEISENNMPTMPWISADIHNTGADGVHVYINEFGASTCDVTGATETDVAIPAGGSIGVDMLDSKIKKVFLVCDVTESTTVEIYATCKYYQER